MLEESALQNNFIVYDTKIKTLIEKKIIKLKKI